MKELFTIPMVIYGIVVGILLILNSAKTTAEKFKEQIVTLNMMSAMFGKQLNKMKSLVTKIYLFQFSLLFGYTLISIWINFYIPFTRYVLLFMLLTLLLELVIKLNTIRKATQFQELTKRKKLTTITPFIYILCIAINIGTML